MGIIKKSYFIFIKGSEAELNSEL